MRFPLPQHATPDTPTIRYDTRHLTLLKKRDWITNVRWFLEGFSSFPRYSSADARKDDTAENIPDGPANHLKEGRRHFCEDLDLPGPFLTPCL